MNIIFSNIKRNVKSASSEYLANANLRYFPKTHSQSPHLASLIFEKYHKFSLAFGAQHFKRMDFS